MWCLETSTRRWSRRSDKTGRVPKPRFGHCAATIGTSIYIFAGHDGKKSLNDLYKFDTSTNVWSDMGSLDNVPKPSPNYQMHASGQDLLVFDEQVRVLKSTLMYYIPYHTYSV